MSRRQQLVEAGLLIASFILLHEVGSLYAQNQEYKFERLSLEQGVSHNLISCIHQERLGFLWFGTMYGLIKYDGYTYTTYRHDPLDPNSLSNDDITALHEDREGNLWIGTYGGGLNKLDRATGKFTRYVHDPTDSTSISHGFVWAICEDRFGRLWLGTEGGGLNRFDPKSQRFTHYKYDPASASSLGSDIIYAIHESRREPNILWIGTKGGGLNRLDMANERFRHYRHDGTNPKSLSHDDVRAICQDNFGNLWIGTQGGGLNKMIEEKEPFVTYKHDPSNPKSLSANFVNTLFEDNAGNLWIGTASGLNKFDRDKQEFTRFFHDPADPNPALRDDNVIAIHQDHSGIFWIGTQYGGLDKLYVGQAKFAHYKHNPADSGSLSSNDIRAIHEDESGTLWIGAGKGLNRFDEQKNQFIHYTPHPDGLDGNAVNALCQDPSGALWIGTLQGLSRFDRRTKAFRHYRHDPVNSNSLSDDAVTSLFASRHEIWIGTAAGLSRLDLDTQIFTRYAHNPADPNSLNNDYILSIYEDKSGALWIGTYSGLNRFDREREQFVHFRQNPNDPHSMSNNYVYAMHEDRTGAFWLGTGGGLNLFDREAGTFTHFTEKDGLPNGVICGILEDGRGALWVSTNKGLSRFDPITKSFKNFDLADGLQSNMFITGAYCKRRNGEMFFGGINGLNRFHPDSLKGNLCVPPVVITAFKKFDRIEKLGRDISYTETIGLSYKDNFFAFEFAALDYTRPEKNQYAYKLEGFDRDWIYSGARRYASYTNLAPGHYLFRVKGSNNDGLWNEAGAAIKITIAPPFWKTLWFYCLAFGVFVATIVLAHNQRVRARIKRSLEIERLRRQENERVRKKAAEDFHDELGHRLTKIALFSEMIKRKLNSAAAEIHEYLDKIIDDSHRLTNDTRDFIWTLDPAKDSLYDVMAHLKEFGDELFDRTAIAFRVIGISEELEKVKLAMEARRQFTLIFKEGMNNALKHAECKNVLLTVEVNGENLRITLSDDGKGYHGNTNGPGYGLKNMQMRAEKIPGALQLISQPEGGATIELTTKVSD